MSVGVLFAFAGAAAGVLAVWDLLALVERAAVVGAATRLLAPVVRAGREGVAPTRSERRRLALLSAGVLACGGLLLGGPPLALLAAIAGPVAAAALVGARRRRFRAALAAAAPSVARALADALSAGRSVRGAVALAAAGLPGAAGHELGAAARALRLGAGTEATLERLRRRAASAAWDALVAGLLLQRDAGGDLPALLRELATALDAAARQERDAAAAVAQARLTARLVLAMPLVAAAATELVDPGFVGSLISEPISAVLAVGAALLQVGALLAVRAIVRRAAR